MPSEKILACSGMPVKLMLLLGGSSLRWEFTSHQGLLNEPKQDHWPSFQQNENFCTFVGTRRDEMTTSRENIFSVLFCFCSEAKTLELGKNGATTIRLLDSPSK